MKAILVVDMPKIDEDTKNGCRNCRYADCGSIGFFESYKCVFTEQCKNVLKMKCPLRPIPTKEEIYERIYQAYGYGNNETYQRIRQEVEDIYDEIFGETGGEQNEERGV